jgi:hypothetical protein
MTTTRQAIARPSNRYTIPGASGPMIYIHQLAVLENNATRSLINKPLKLVRAAVIAVEDMVTINIGVLPLPRLGQR